MRGFTEAIKHLLIVNVLFFIASMLYQGVMYDLFTLWFVESDGFKWWQFLTHMFMHASPSHILFNMFVLWMFGTALEQSWGKEKFLFFFFSAGIGAALVQTGVNYYNFHEGLNAMVQAGIDRFSILDTLQQGKINTTWAMNAPFDAVETVKSEFFTRSLGASGATSGILAAYAFMFPNRELSLLFLPIPLKAKFFIPLMFVGDLYYGFSGAENGIAYFAHIGGALFGLFMVWFWKKNQFNDKRWD